MEKITARDLYTAIINGEALSQEMVNKAQSMLDALDAKNDKRKSPTSKDKMEVNARRIQVLNILASTTDALDRETIADLAGMTVGQATNALTALVKDDKVTKTEVKMDKKRKMMYIIKN